MTQAEFESKFIPHYEYVFRYLLRMNLEKSQAEDITQQAFLLAWRRADSFRGGCHPKSWLVKIAVNAFRMEYRKRDLDQLPDSFECSTFCDPDVAIDVRSTLKRISPAAIKILTKRYLLDTEVKTMASCDGIKIGAEKSRILRAKVKFKDEWNK